MAAPHCQQSLARWKPWLCSRQLKRLKLAVLRQKMVQYIGGQAPAHQNFEAGPCGAPFPALASTAGDGPCWQPAAWRPVHRLQPCHHRLP